MFEEQKTDLQEVKLGVGQFAELKNEIASLKGLAKGFSYNCLSKNMLEAGRPLSFPLK